MTDSERIKELERRNKELEEQLSAKNKLSLKVSAKGAVSIYGLGRFPVTLYQTQWTRLFEYMPEVKKFIDANSGRLANKGDIKAAA